MLGSINSWLGIPLPFTTVDFCCSLVSTDSMNIFNFGNSITLSLFIISLVPPLAVMSRVLGSLPILSDSAAKSSVEIPLASSKLDYGLHC